MFLDIYSVSLEESSWLLSLILMLSNRDAGLGRVTNSKWLFLWLRLNNQLTFSGIAPL